MVSLLVLLLLLFVAPFESRQLSKSDKVQVLDLSDLPQDEDDEDRILPDETDPCLIKTVVYTDPDDVFFDLDLMQVVISNVIIAGRMNHLHSMILAQYCSNNQVSLTLLDPSLL